MRRCRSDMLQELRTSRGGRERRNPKREYSSLLAAPLGGNAPSMHRRDLLDDRGTVANNLRRLSDDAVGQVLSGRGERGHGRIQFVGDAGDELQLLQT